MKKLLLVCSLALCIGAPLFAAEMDYDWVLGRTIISEQEKLNSFNPAGIQFSSNFFQFEIYNDVPAAGVTDPANGGNTVMFAFPLTASYRLNNLMAFRVSIYEDASTPYYSALTGLSSAHLANLDPFMPIGITWAMKLSDTMGIGVMYKPELAFQGKFNDDNFQAGYFNNRITPGFFMKMNNLTLNAFLPLALTLAGASEASTNANTTNNLALKMPLSLISGTFQASYKLSDIFLLAGRIEGGLKMEGYEVKGVTLGTAATNSVDANSMKLDLIAGIKVVPVALLDIYADLGFKMYSHDVRSVSGTTTNRTTHVNQFSLPTLALGVNVKPDKFIISLGFRQDIVATSSELSGTPTVVNSDWQIAAFSATALDGNSQYSIVRTASAGLGYKFNDTFQIDTILDIRTTSFLGNEIDNPLYAISCIFNSSTGAPATLFSGARLNIKF